MSLKIFILGANGFIGSSLIETILATTNWEVSALDLHQHHLSACLPHPRLQFKQGDMRKEQAWIENELAMADVVLPLAAIATPATYVKDPLRIFELDFEANLEIVRRCVDQQRQGHAVHLIFPSTSEVYGMCPDNEFDEENSVLVTGPINKERWIYSCAKQMMDRIIYAYGQKENFSYTLFRPFNWMGARLDNVLNPQPGGSRVITQFVGNILRGEPIALVDGGAQKRSFLDIDDGIAALIKIIENKDDSAKQEIFNIGNPTNELSVRELAELLIELLQEYPAYKFAAQNTVLKEISGKEYFGAGYQDIQRRVPAISKAANLLNWQPKITVATSLRKILDFHLA